MGNSGIPSIPVVALPVPGVYTGEYANLNLNNQLYGGIVVNDAMKTFGAGTQLADNPNNTISLTNNGTFQNLHTPQLYDTTGVNLGDYELTSIGQLTGTLTTDVSYNYGMKTVANVTWANATATHVQSVDTSMQFNGLINTVPPAVSLAKKLPLTIAGSGGAASDMLPSNITLVQQGLTNSGVTGPGFANMGYQLLRVTKGEL